MDKPTTVKRAAEIVSKALDEKKEESIQRPECSGGGGAHEDACEESRLGGEVVGRDTFAHAAISLATTGHPSCRETSMSSASHSADKLALALTPWWLYLPMVRATGEIDEYMAHAQHRVKGNEAVSDDERRRLTSGDQRAWYSGVQAYMRRWVEAHKDGARDTWTSDSRQRATLDERGVWR